MKSCFIIIGLISIHLVTLSQNQKKVDTSNPVDAQFVLTLLQNIPLYQIPGKEVVHILPDVKEFYKGFSINGELPDSLSCYDLATVGLAAVQALDETTKELERNQKMLEETTNRLNEVTNQALKMSEIANQLQSKVTDLESKLNNLEFQMKELESEVKR